MQAKLMRVCALIPVKPLNRVKTRLSLWLSLDERVQLVAAVLQRLVYVLRDSAVADAIVVVSRDAEVLSWAREKGLVALQERGSSLNAALRQGREHCKCADALLVLPTDLVAVQASDLVAMVNMASMLAGDCVVLAPDRHGRGTNALLLKPPQVIDFAFGRDSVRQHMRHAQSRGVPVLTYRSDSISLDIDALDDLIFYAQQW